MEKFSPGHYDLTFVLGQNGLNEDAIFLLDVSLNHIEVVLELRLRNYFTKYLISFKTFVSCLIAFLIQSGVYKVEQKKAKHGTKSPFEQKNF